MSEMAAGGGLESGVSAWFPLAPELAPLPSSDRCASLG